MVTNLGDTVISHPYLSPALSNFLDKIASWQATMPDHLVHDMESLGNITAKARQAEKC